MPVQLNNGFKLMDDATISNIKKFNDLVTANSTTPTTELPDNLVFHLLFGKGNGYYNCNENFQPIGPLISDNRKLNASFIFEVGNKIKIELSENEKLVPVSSTKLTLTQSLADKISGKPPKMRTLSTSSPMHKKQKTYFSTYDKFAVYMRLLDGVGIIKVNDIWNSEKSNIYCPILTTGDAEYFGIIRPPPIPGVKIEYTQTPPVNANGLQFGKMYYVDTTGITYLYADKDDDVDDDDVDDDDDDDDDDDENKKKWEDKWKKLPARVCKFIGIFTEMKYVEDQVEKVGYKIPQNPFSLNTTFLHSYASFTPERKFELERRNTEPFDTVKIVPGYKNSFGELKPEQILVKTNETMTFYPMETIEDHKQKDPEYKETVNNLFLKRNIPEDIEDFITKSEYDDP